MKILNKKGKVIPKSRYFSLSPYLTPNTIYIANPILSPTGNHDDEYYTIYEIICDDLKLREFDSDLFITIEENRENKLNSILQTNTDL